MRFMHPQHFALLLLGLAACAPRPGSTDALRIEVTFAADSVSRCAVVKVHADGAGPLSTRAMPRDEEVLAVALFRRDLPERVTVEAEGFTDETCAGAPAEHSGVVEAVFTREVSTVSLRLAPELRDGGVDAGVVDAGSDAGVEDAGLPDAGFEDCANGIDDDGNSLVDCADPRCPAMSACDDGDACTDDDVCEANVCTGRLMTCTMQLPACVVPTGCDAGLCTVAPVAERTFCDGGQCDGTGRCAPFCDSSRTGLRGCWRFEGDGLDESGHDNNGTTTGGGFDGGARGLAAFPGSVGWTMRDHASLDCTNEITLEAWVLLTAHPTGRYGVIDNDGQYSIFIGAGGELRCSANGVANVPAAVPIGAWTHVACIRGGGTIKAYVNGVERHAAAVSGPLQNGNDNALMLGMDSPSTNDVLQGALDGVRLWCEALAPADLCATFGECG